LRGCTLQTFIAGFLVVAVLGLAGCTTTGSTGSSRSNALDDHIQLGLNYIGEGNRQMARTHLLRALELDKRSPGAHHGMALLFQLELEKDLAEKHFKQALAADRNFTRARNNYAVFLFQEGRFEDAYRQFEIAGEDVNYEMRPPVFYGLGVAADRLGKSAEAEEAWLKAIALTPRYASPYLELGDLYLRQEKFALARRYLEAYDQLAQPQARSLWLAVRIARHFGDKDAEASKGLALEKLFPDSRERREYEKWRKNEAL